MSISNLTVLHKIDRDVSMSSDFLPDGILTIHNANYLRYLNAINILFIKYFLIIFILLQDNFKLWQCFTIGRLNCKFYKYRHHVYFA